MFTLGFWSHRHMLARDGCDPIFDCRETAMRPRNSHLETLRRTQNVGDCLKWTFSEAYPCMTSTCHTPCIHAAQRLRVELEQRISTHEETLEKAARNKQPWRRRFGTRHDGSTQAPSDSYRSPEVRLVQQTHLSYTCMQALSYTCMQALISRDC